MSFRVLAPEINSLRIFACALSGPMLAAAAARDGLASELGSAADSFWSVTTGLAAQAWQGPASEAMVAAAAPYTGWLSASATQASGAAAQAKAVASVLESALAAAVHPAAATANRSRPPSSYKREHPEHARWERTRGAEGPAPSSHQRANRGR